MKKVKVAVIGTGSLGQHHVRVFSELQNAELKCIVDLDKERVRKISQKYNVKWYNDYREIVNFVDAVSIVTPTVTHYSISRDIISRGINCFIEKPITNNLDEAKKLIKIAKEKKVILQVGHIERFNPAIIELYKHINDIRFIETYRLGVFDPRVKDIGVVLDLMIHDIDIILSLVKSKIKKVEAFGAKVFTQNEDIAKVRIFFENNCIADLTASRVSAERYRKIRIFQSDSYISVDYIARTIKIKRKKRDKVMAPEDIEIIEPEIDKTESLKLELSHFIDCILKNRQPLVTGEDGKNALEVSLKILEKMKIYE